MTLVFGGEGSADDKQREGTKRKKGADRRRGSKNKKGTNKHVQREKREGT